MFDFDPEAYYPINDQPFSPTRPPRPQRPTRATFYRPSTPRPLHNHHSVSHHHNNNHHYPRPTSPPYTRPTRPPPATRPPSHYRPKPEPVDFYPSYYKPNKPYKPEENEVEDTGGDRQGLGHLSTASTMLKMIKHMLMIMISILILQ